MKKPILILYILICSFAAKAQVQKTDSTTTVHNSVSDISTDSLVFMAVEHEPQFPGGSGALNKFLVKNLQYQKDYNGKVIATFIVEKDGSLSKIQILRSFSNDATTEAMRIMKLFPKWIPGTQNDRAVRVQYTIAIKFGS